jgi:hypothetical protein
VRPEEAFLDALATAGALEAPGFPIGVERVAERCGLDRQDAIRIGLELMSDGLISGTPLEGDDEVKTINGLELTGPGRRRLQSRRAEQFLFALEEKSGGDPDAAVSAWTIGQLIGWTERETRYVADSLSDDGYIEDVEMGSDSVTMTGAGRAYLDRAVAPREDGTVGDVSINRGNIARMMSEIQAEFDKHAIRVPVQADPAIPGAGNHTTIYNGPVIHGDANGVQLAWGNNSVFQQQSTSVAPGYEALAQALVSTLERLPGIGLSDDDQADAEAAGQEALLALAGPDPDQGVIRRSLSALKGHLAQLALGAAVGAEQGAQEWAKTAIQHLHLPF